MSSVSFSSAVMAAKSKILEEEGYAYNFDRMVYFNRRAKKAFSVEFVEDHTVDQLRERIMEKTNGTQWQFYTNSILPPAVKHELEGALG
jgi:hypothetical protein